MVSDHSICEKYWFLGVIRTGCREGKSEFDSERGFNCVSACVWFSANQQHNQQSTKPNLIGLELNLLQAN